MDEQRVQSLVGRQFGPYRILTWLGAGGMGDVYRARDLTLGREVAIKVVSAAFTRDHERLARFDREARLLAALNHPHVAAIYGVEDAGGVRALVMELVEGPTLAERLEQGPMSVTEALTVARQVADALEAAHEKGIVHRDLKPANIKLTPSGAVKVLDFGLAKTMDVGSETDSAAPTATALATRDGLILGTAAYMSPEQARGHSVDRRTDIWAFGCTLYEMLAGRTAFGGATVPDTIAAVLSRQPDLDAVPAATPSAVRRLLTRCLAKDPVRRLHDIADARIEIDDALSGAGSDVPAIPTAPAVQRQLRRYQMRERIAWVSAIAALAWLAYLLVSPTRADDRRAVVEFPIFPEKDTTFPSSSPPSVSADGRHVAFVALASNGQQQLWVRSLASSSARSLPGTEGAMRPFWSPDGRAVAYFANGQLWRVDLETGTSRALCDAPYVGGLAGTWGDGVIVFAAAEGFHQIRAEGGARSRLSMSTQGFEPVFPRFLPDGRRFLYVALRSLEGENELCVGSVDSPATSCGPRVPSPVAYSPPGHLLFVLDGALHVQAFDVERLAVAGAPVPLSGADIEFEYPWAPPPFSVSAGGVLVYRGAGVSPLVWLDRSGKRVEVVGTGTIPAVTRDGRRIVVERRDRRTGRTDLWLLDRARRTESRLTFDPARDGQAAFSPKGDQVVFASQRGGASQLYTKPVIGTSDEQLVAPIRGAGIPDWSADGRFILYQAFNRQTGFDLWALRLDVDRTPVEIARTVHGEREGRFSPDVRWIAYDSTESGRRDIWIQPFPPTGSRRQLSTTGGVSPRWRGDGKELFYVAADGMLMAVAIDTSSSTLEWRTPQPLFQTMFRSGVYASYTVSHDGLRVLMNVPPSLEDTTPITVVLNWTAGVKE